MSGKLLASLSTGNDKIIEKVYTVPDNTVVTCFITITNTQSNTNKVRLGIGNVTTPGNKDFILYDYEIQGNATYERNGITLSPKEQVFIYSDKKNVVVRIEGIETDIRRIRID